jgi:hypothetical protein
LRGRGRSASTNAQGFGTCPLCSPPLSPRVPVDATPLQASNSRRREWLRRVPNVTTEKLWIGLMLPLTGPEMLMLPTRWRAAFHVQTTISGLRAMARICSIPAAAISPAGTRRIVQALGAALNDPGRAIIAIVPTPLAGYRRPHGC